MNAHGESPPARARPPKKNLFLEGYTWYRRIGFPVFSLMEGVSANGGFMSKGGFGLNDMCVREIDEASAGDEEFLYREVVK